MAYILNPTTVKIPFTKDAYAKLQADFARLSQEKIDLMARLKTAREMGDLSENGAYKYAKIELGSVGRQLRHLRHLLENGEIIVKKATSTTVEFGSTVTLKNAQDELTYTIVSMHESDMLEHKLSIESPIGQAIMGKKVGEEVAVKTPGGTIIYTIMAVR